MFCPKCGNALVEGETTRCSEEDWTLTSDWARALLDGFMSKKRESASEVANWNVDETWYCPGCGKDMCDRAPEAFVCTECQGHVDAFVQTFAGQPLTGSPRPKGTPEENGS